jgi:hypothetical protein
LKIRTVHNLRPPFPGSKVMGTFSKKPGAAFTDRTPLLVPEQ